MKPVVFTAASNVIILSLRGEASDDTTFTLITEVRGCDLRGLPGISDRSHIMDLIIFIWLIHFWFWCCIFLVSSIRHCSCASGGVYFGERWTGTDDLLYPYPHPTAGNSLSEGEIQRQKPAAAEIFIMNQQSYDRLTDSSHTARETDSVFIYTADHESGSGFWRSWTKLKSLITE